MLILAFLTFNQNSANPYSFLVCLCINFALFRGSPILSDLCSVLVLIVLLLLRYLIQLIILSLYTVYILTLDLLILSFNGFHLI